jgi:hypothetical protein
MGPQDASDRIWLKQSVQFSVGGQVRTIEIALPVRPGASAEEIERLLQQADAGLDQMTRHLNSRVSELLDQEKTQTPSRADAAPRMPQRPQGAEELAAPAERGRTSGIAAGAGVQPGKVGAASEGAGMPTSRPAEMTPAAGAALDRKQFIAEIAVLGLNPRQAMERLGLRSLDGVNLRQALEQLRLQLLHERPASAGGAGAPGEDVGGSAPDNPPARGTALPQTGAPPRRPSPELKHTAPLAQAAPAERPVLRPLPERGLLADEEDQPADVPAPERDAPRSARARAPMPIPIRGERTMSALQERVRAQALLERLRRIKGRLNPPSSDNLKAFRYVVEEQIGAEKTAALLQVIWNVPLPEQLSPDQVAECIRWGKDDHFEDEVDMLLKLMAAEES